MHNIPRVLVIDGESAFLDNVRNAFADCFDVTCALTGEDGLRIAKRETPDVILLGYVEPRGSARDIAAKLAEEKRTATIPVLVIDVRPDEYPRKGWRWSDGFSHNVKGYVWRPIGNDTLVETTKGVLQRSQESPMNLTEVAQQTEEMLKRIDQLKKLLMSETESRETREGKKEG